MPHTDTIPVSASIASTGLGIRYVGNWAYAYSGEHQIATSDVTHLSFTSDSKIFVGTIEAIGPTKPADPNSGNSALFHLTFNGIEISTLKMDTEVEDMPSFVSMNIVIPPLTEVKVIVRAGGTTSGMVTSCNIVGRVYGAE